MEDCRWARRCFGSCVETSHRRRSSMDPLVVKCVLDKRETGHYSWTGQACWLAIPLPRNQRAVLEWSAVAAGYWVR